MASFARKPSSFSSMRQTTLVSSSRTNQQQSQETNAMASRKRPAAAIIEILDDDKDEPIGAVPYPRFLEMWKDVEEDDGWETSDFEETNAFKKANNETDPSDFTGSKQKKAQYGRLSFKATRLVLERVAALKWFQVFLDIGHGVGNTVLQGAYTIPAYEARGIELVGFRHERAQVYEQKLKELDTLINQKRDGKVRK